MKHKKMIIAAANKYNVYKDGELVMEDYVIVDAGHFLRNMYNTLDLLKQAGYELKPVKDRSRGQGFISENGEYFDRADALDIVKASGQQFNPEYELSMGFVEEGLRGLDSSCIRHFPEDINFSDMCNNFLPEKCCMRMEMMGECDCD